MQKTAAKEKRKSGPALQNILYSAPNKKEYAFFFAVAVVFYFAFAHPDITETARHAYILLLSTFDGDFLMFFENTLSLKYGYIYSNAAHYNILLYIGYAVFELPLFIVEKLFNFAFSDNFLAYWCKFIGTAFYVGCAVLTGKIAKLLSFSEEGKAWAPLLFLLSPIAFFTTVVMGQYDSICLYFLLLALTFYFKKNHTAFSLLVGVGAVFKFFPLFLFIPLLLLVEKRPLHIAKYGVYSLWLLLPTSLLFAGRTGDANVFTAIMIERVLAVKFTGGIMNYSVFGTVMACVCAFCLLYRPKTDEALWQAALYTGLFVFGTLFMLVYWHPQWLILLLPFMLLAILQNKHQSSYFYLAVLFYIGFFIAVAAVFPGALEWNMLNNTELTKALVLNSARRTNIFYFYLFPLIAQATPILFHGALAALLLFLFPFRGSTFGERLSNGEEAHKVSYRLVAWGTFATAFCGFWLAPSAFSFLKTLGYL